MTYYNNNWDLSRENRLLLALEEWKRKGKRGSIIAPARVGKTFIGIEALKLYSNSHVKGILCRNAIVKYQWKIAMRSIDPPITNYHVVSIEELKNSDLIFDILILDEAHRYMSEESLIAIGNSIKSKVVDNNGTKVRIYDSNLLGLTATLPIENKELNWFNSLIPPCDTIQEEVCINEGWISPYIEFNLGLSLSEEDQERYVEYTNYIAETFEVFNNIESKLPENMRYYFKGTLDIIGSLDRGKFIKGKGKLETTKLINFIAEAYGWRKDLPDTNDINRTIIKYYQPDSIKRRAAIFQETIRSRNSLLIDNSAKIEASVDIVNEFPNLKFISFSQSVNYAETLAYKLNSKFGTIVGSMNGNPVVNNICEAFHSNIESIYMIDPLSNPLDYYRTRKGEKKKIGKVTIKKMILEKLKRGIIRGISAVDSLNEGFDISDLSLAIVSSGDCNAIKDYQRKSRTKTRDFSNDAKVGIIFNLYFKDFVYKGKSYKNRDLSKLRQRQTGKNIYEIYSIKDAKNVLKSLDIVL